MAFYPLRKSLFSFQNNNLFNLIVPKQILELTYYLTFICCYFCMLMYDNHFIFYYLFLFLYLFLVSFQGDNFNGKGKVREQITQKMFVFSHSSKNSHKICYELEAWIHVCSLAFQVMTQSISVSSISYRWSREHTYRGDSGFHGSQADRYISLYWETVLLLDQTLTYLCTVLPICAWWTN